MPPGSSNNASSSDKRHTYDLTQRRYGPDSIQWDRQGGEGQGQTDVSGNMP